MSSADVGFSSKLGITLLVLFFIGVHGDIEFVLSRNKGTWEKASSSCKSIRGNLAILDNLELQRAFDRDVTSAPGERVWVGRYVGYSQTVTINGCYRNQTLALKRSKLLVNNYLVTCLRECQDTAYIGLQGQLCYCVDKIPLQAAPVPGAYCRSQCPGENSGSSATELAWCGRQDPAFDTVSIYRKVRPGEIKMDLNVPNQGECIAYNAREDKWLPLNCNQPKLFTCDRLQCSAPSPMCVLESNAQATWYQARAQCEGTNSRLATVNSTTNNFFKQKVIFNDPIYWTALHRKEVIVWSYENSLNDIEQSDRCFAAVKQQNGGWQLLMDWCSNEHKYACVQDHKTKPTSTEPPKTTSFTTKTTRRPTTVTTFSTSTSETLPTVDPYATPLSVTSSAGKLFMWIRNFAFVTVFQLASLSLTVRYFTAY
ncbi:uncharacterized protein LOC123561330 [Mercenaria mercenaria]|uniref:uncharacterized protein LOC123561330 n=1 Tax=Mercenaria mercenaria TaxID=6596 RepID=UPI00234E59E1|nr:uncharacterized protein LOC123561330 [Mercenaria mercenaria]